MKTSNAGRAFIESWEGLRLKAYKDTSGILTIGYGHTSAAGLPKVTSGMQITQPEADQILARDLEGVEKDIANLVKVSLNQNQYDAIVSFQYNTGALGKSSALKSLNKKDYAGAIDKMGLYNQSPKGTVNKGLVNRRNAEKSLFNKPVTGVAEPTTAGAVVVGGATALTQAPHEHWPWIIGGTIVALIVGLVIVRAVKRGTQNVATN